MIDQDIIIHNIIDSTNNLLNINFFKINLFTNNFTFILNNLIFGNHVIESDLIIKNLAGRISENNTDFIEVIDKIINVQNDRLFHIIN
jgi:hypothetical protein